MLYLESLNELQRKTWIKTVIANVMELHGVNNRNDLDLVYGLPLGTINNLVSNGSYKRVVDIAITASLSFNVSLDELLLNNSRVKSLPDWKPLIANGVFKSLEAGVLSIEYPNIEVAADIILDEVLSAETRDSVYAS